MGWVDTPRPRELVAVWRRRQWQRPVRLVRLVRYLDDGTWQVSRYLGPGDDVSRDYPSEEQARAVADRLLAGYGPEWEQIR